MTELLYLISQQTSLNECQLQFAVKFYTNVKNILD